MDATPEGRVKALVSAYLRSVPGLWYNMPVPSGYGRPTLDYLGCVKGRFFAIETKAPGKKPTGRQEATMEAMRAAGAAVFVVRDADDLCLVKEWVAAQLPERT